MSNIIYTIISRAEAKAQNLKWYFTGKPCNRGHVDKRLVHNCGCKGCAQISAKKFYTNNADQIKQKVKDWIGNNPEKYKAQNNNPKKLAANKQWAKDNPELSSQIGKNWKNNNKEHVEAYNEQYRADNSELINARSKQWRKDNPHKVMEYHDSRKERIKVATPRWADNDKIREIYIERDVIIEQTGIQHQVDHHYPLFGKNVCGLHVENNLVILTTDEHKNKGCKHPDDFYN
jgi:hypothetical protein